MVSKSRVGVSLLLIASILYSAKYISAAIIVSSFEIPNSAHLSGTLKQFPSIFTYWIFAAATIGAILTLRGLLSKKEN